MFNALPASLPGFVFPLVMKALLDAVGFRWTLRIWAAFMAVVGSIAVWSIRHRVPVPKFSSQCPQCLGRGLNDGEREAGSKW